MKRTAIAALGAAMIATLGAGSAAEAATINFDFSALDGSIIHDGSSLSDSTCLDFDDAIELVTSLGPGDASGLNEFDTITLTGQPHQREQCDHLWVNAWPARSRRHPVVADGRRAWRGHVHRNTDHGDVDRHHPSADPDFIIVTLTGTLTDTQGLFTNTPVVLIVHRHPSWRRTSRALRSPTRRAVTPSIPEPSTWAMMALGFAALGYAGFRKRLNFGRMAGNGTPSV